jgi:hypothetical protein
MLTREQATALADLVHLLRPEWDRAGIFTALGHCQKLNPFDVAMAAIRAAASPDVRTPGVIPNTRGDHWHEKVAPPTSPRPPKPHEACRVCGRHHDACDCDGGPTVRPVVTADSTRAVARLRAAHQTATADHCSHHVPRVNCIEHRHHERAE